MERLRGIHAGQTAYIVGKGPSLLHLRAKHFGPGPVLTLNDAIFAVLPLRLDNPTYSLQNDGEVFAVPEHVTLLTNSVYPGSIKPRIEWDAVAMGLEGPAEMVVIVAVSVARMMGCARFVVLCCDSLAGRSRKTCTPHADGSFTVRMEMGDGSGPSATHCYTVNRPRILAALAALPYDLVTPEAGNPKE